MNQLYKISNLSKLFLFIVATAILFTAGSASAVTKPRQGADTLLDTYRANLAKLETSSFGLPLFLDSFERGDRVHVDVYGIFEYTFSSIVNVLKVPANWCDIVSLHPNVKACTYRESPGAGLLTFYIGKKVYQPPEETRQVIYKYRVVYFGFFSQTIFPQIFSPHRKISTFDSSFSVFHIPRMPF